MHVDTAYGLFHSCGIATEFVAVRVGQTFMYQSQRCRVTKITPKGFFYTNNLPKPPMFNPLGYFMYHWFYQTTRSFKATYKFKFVTKPLPVQKQIQ
jgi:hypothetical protein